MAQSTPKIDTKEMVVGTVAVVTMDVGISATSSNNPKLRRGGDEELEIVQGDDTTVEGTRSPNKIQVNVKNVLVGTDATLTNNVKMHRSGDSEIQFVLGDDTTSEGSISSNEAYLRLPIQSVDTQHIVSGAVKDFSVSFGTAEGDISAQTIPADVSAPSNYTPIQEGSEGTNKISAHLKGINSSLGSLSALAITADTTPSNYTPIQEGSEGVGKISAHLNGINSSFGNLSALTITADTTPSNYTPVQEGSEGTDKISAHLNGIDSTLGSTGSTVGDIVQSLLTESQYQSINGAGWVLMNGRNIAGSDLATLTGNTTLPDARGQFLRSKNNGRADGNENPDGEIVLGIQTTDKFGSHSHTVGRGTELLVFSYSGGQYEYSTRGGGSTKWTGAQGSNETCPKNITVNYFIKINN